MWLHVYTGNRAAIRFYEQMGYRLLHIAEDFYGAGVDARVYIRALNPA
jgi:ribosomal protein S18 acetylase RimI-like enzyme